MDRITRRGFGSGLASVGLAGLLRPARAQQSYPRGQSIKFVVPFPAGGATDIIGRVIAGHLGTLWQCSTYVENLPGAGANIGNDRVAKGPADGNQILIISPSLATNQSMYAHLTYDPEKDFIPLVQVASLPNLLNVRKTLPVNTVADLIAYAKANPGKLNFASSGVGTTVHLSGELFKKLAGIDMVHVPYRGGAPALNDLLAGAVDLSFDNIPSVIGHARDGQLKPLGVTSPARSSFAPDIPSISETVPGYAAISWFGVGVRAGTPKEICDIIERDTRAVCQLPAVRERFATLVTETVGSSSAEFATYISAERAKWSKLITELKIQAD